MIGTDACAGAHCAAVLVNKAGSTDADALIAASEGLEYSTATGIGTMTNRHVVKDIYLAECVDAEFNIIPLPFRSATPAIPAARA